jgi:ADP-ribose pyrophosphatase
MSSEALFHVTVKGVIVIDGKMLLLKKVKESKDKFGFWELPGGGMEFGETPVEAMQREALEEAGLTIDVLKPISTFHLTRKDKQIVGIVFLCCAKSLEVHLSDEHSEYVFVTQQEAQNYLAPTIYKDTFSHEVLNFMHK